MAMASPSQYMVAGQAPKPTGFDAQGVSSSSGTADGKIESQVQALERQLAQLQVKAQSSIATAALMANWNILIWAHSRTAALELAAHCSMCAQPCFWHWACSQQRLHLLLHQLMGNRELSHPI